MSTGRKVGIGLTCGGVPVFFLGMIIYNEYKQWYQLFSQHKSEIAMSYMLMFVGIMLIVAGVILIVSFNKTKNK